MHVDDCPVRCLLALRAIPNHTLSCYALHTAGGLLQMTYPRLQCLSVSRWIHTVGDTVTSPTARETEDRQFCSHLSFKAGCLAMATVTPRCLFWPGSLVSPVLSSTGQLDPAFSIVLSFLQLLHSGLPHSPLVFILPTPLQLFPCTNFPFVDYMA